MGNVAEKQDIFGGSLLPDKLGFFFIPEKSKKYKVHKEKDFSVRNFRIN